LRGDYKGNASPEDLEKVEKSPRQKLIDKNVEKTGLKRRETGGKFKKEVLRLGTDRTI